MRRNQQEYIQRDLESKKVVFIVGPRQVGKTWLAKEIAKNYNGAVYLNYDDSEHREIMKDRGWLPTAPLVVFDELQKMNGWKNYLKGVYDTKPDNMRIMVTGSARLDAERAMGDSLAGRFFLHRLLPFTLRDLEGTPYARESDRLFMRGGFPEPFLAESEEDALRWRTLYSDALLRQDVLDFASVEHVASMRQVFDLLRHRVGSTISYSALARDIGISPMTVKRYMSVFEALYMIFLVRPYAHKISRAILKEPKIYFFDHALVQNGDGAKFENMVAVALLERMLKREDTTGIRGRLAFLKTKEAKEVDFAEVNADNGLERLIEAKISDGTPGASLRYFAGKYAVPSVQVVQHLRNERAYDNLITVRSAALFLRELR